MYLLEILLWKKRKNSCVTYTTLISDPVIPSFSIGQALCHGDDRSSSTSAQRPLRMIGLSGVGIAIEPAQAPYNPGVVDCGWAKHISFSLLSIIQGSCATCKATSKRAGN